MTTGKAARIVGWILLQVYEKQGKVHPKRDAKNWRHYDEKEIDVLRLELLDQLLGPEWRSERKNKNA